MNRKEQSRLMVLNQVGMGKIVGREAAEVLGLSLRQVRRLLTGYRKEGAAALAHGNQGRKPHHALGGGLRQQVLELVSSPVNRFNHLTAFARICSAVFVHTKGLAPSFHRERKAFIAPTRRATLSKLPLRIAWLVSMPNQISTIFIQEAPVGVK